MENLKPFPRSLRKEIKIGGKGMDLHQRHTDFQSAALLTELPYHEVVREDETTTFLIPTP